MEIFIGKDQVQITIV